MMKIARACIAARYEPSMLFHKQDVCDILLIHRMDTIVAVIIIG